MFTKIRQLILKIKCRKIYKQLPTAVKMQLYLEMNLPENSNVSYMDILKRELELKSENIDISNGLNLDDLRSYSFYDLQK